MSTINVSDGMAVWDEQRWKEFEASLQRSLRSNRQPLTGMQKLAEEARYAGARPVYWISLGMALAVWMI
jgi:hypothetical protein